MMSVVELIDAKVSRLSPELQAEVLTFVKFLDFKQAKDQKAVTKSLPRLPNRFGAGKEVSTYMADDFDAPLDDFSEYMQA